MTLAHRVATRHGEIAFEALGEGPPVVLVHGTPSRAAAWREVASTLASDHRVFVYDLLGFGESERHIEQDVSLAIHGEVLAELLRAWRLDRPALVGHDIGGAIVLRAHLVEGVDVAGLALVDAVVMRPWITKRTRAMQQEVERYAPLPNEDLARTIREHLGTATSRPLPPDVFDALFDQWAGPDGQALYLRNLRCLNEDDTDSVEARLERISVPVRIVWGRDDAWLPVETSHRIADAIGGVLPTVLDDAGHFSMLDRPEAVSAALRRFLAEVGGPPRAAETALP